jgi:sodium/hydrogen antiporter
MLLNVSIFLWYGAVCPWHMFVDNNVIPIYRLVFLGVLILLVRRLPIIFAMHKQISQIEDWRQALFVGYFGPIGVSGVFYLYIALDWLGENVIWQGAERDDAARLSEILTVIVWFMVVCSVVVHGLSIPLGKLGLYLPRTLSRAISMESSRAYSRDNLPRLSRQPSNTPMDEESHPQTLSFPAPLWRAGRKLANSFRDATSSLGNSTLASSKATKRHTPGIVTPGEGIPIFQSPQTQSPKGDTTRSERPSSSDHPPAVESPEEAGIGSAPPSTGYPFTRSIRFPDEPVHTSNLSLSSNPKSESSSPLPKVSPMPKHSLTGNDE